MADKDINQATLPTKALLGEDVNDVKTEVSEEKSPRIIPRNLKNTGSRCCVVGCKNRRGLDKIQNISRSYYRFPKDNKLAKMWIAALNRAHWKPTAWDRVCSDHFPHGIRTYTPGTVGYVPSIFPTKAIPTPRSTNNSSKASYSVQLNHLEKPSSSSCTTKTSSPITESNAVWECEHDYIQTKEDPESSPLHTELQKRIMELEMEVSFLKKKVLTLDAIKDDDKEFQFWTNMPNYSVFEAVSSYLKHRCGGRLVYWNGARTVKHKHFSTCMAKKPGRERTLTFEDEFFMTLVKLKTGKLHKAALDKEKNGPCPLCQQYFMALYILRDKGLIDLVVTTFLPETPPAEILKFSTGKKYPLIKIHRGMDARGENLSEQCCETLDDIDELLDRFQVKSMMSRHRSVDEGEAEKLFDDILPTFKLFITNEKHDSTKLIRKLKHIDDALHENGTKFLLSDELSRADCMLMPRLQHIRVAGYAYRGFDIPEDMTYLWQYIEDCYATDAFKESCPANEDIVKHYERNTLPDRKRRDELRRKGTTRDVPVRAAASSAPADVDGANGESEIQQEMEQVHVDNHEHDHISD